MLPEASTEAKSVSRVPRLTSPAPVMVSDWVPAFVPIANELAVKSVVASIVTDVIPVLAVVTLPVVLSAPVEVMAR